ncbi:beta-D-galactosidase [Mycobacterium paragordonae]|uniref:beta-D-galactosidase n=1 Tax=Mycobacterium paragordonae TaxID=1389713 RepID=UPI0012E1E127|nr:cupin domain-containing protein [Mycobacterium paragordonae]
MNVTRASDAPAYAAPAHHRVSTARLQGLEAGPTERFWVGVSLYQPGGKAEQATAPAETVYVVLDGELVICTDEGETVLGRLDSVHLAKGETRSIVNCSEEAALLLVTIAYPDEDQS